MKVAATYRPFWQRTWWYYLHPYLLGTFFFFGMTYNKKLSQWYLIKWKLVQSWTCSVYLRKEEIKPPYTSDTNHQWFSFNLSEMLSLTCFICSFADPCRLSLCWWENPCQQKPSIHFKIQKWAYPLFIDFS